MANDARQSSTRTIGRWASDGYRLVDLFHTDRSLRSQFPQALMAVNGAASSLYIPITH